MSLRPQAVAQIDEVVDLAVEDDRVPRMTIDHRLVAQGRKVEDRQAAKAQADHRACRVTTERKTLESIVVGPTVDHRPHHATHGRLDDASVTAQKARDTAHGTPEGSPSSLAD